MITAYLAGPDVFLPNAGAHAAAKRAICARHGIAGRSPLKEDIATLAGMDEAEAWRAIVANDIAMLEGCAIIIANLTPFRGASADAGTLVELGWFLGRGRPAYGYTNSAQGFAARSAAQVAAVPDPMPGLTVGGFGLPDNFMIAGALRRFVTPEDGRDLAFDALDMFETCVRAVATSLVE